MSYYEFILALILVTGYTLSALKRNNRPALQTVRLNPNL